MQFTYLNDVTRLSQTLVIGDLPDAVGAWTVLDKLNSASNVVALVLQAQGAAGVLHELRVYDMVSQQVLASRTLEATERLISGNSTQGLYHIASLVSGQMTIRSFLLKPGAGASLWQPQASVTLDVGAWTGSLSDFVSASAQQPGYLVMRNASNEVGANTLLQFDAQGHATPVPWPNGNWRGVELFRDDTGHTWAKLQGQDTAQAYELQALAGGVVWRSVTLQTYANAFDAQVVDSVPSAPQLTALAPELSDMAPLVDVSKPQFTQAAAVQLEASGVLHGADFSPQVAALGNSGGFVVTWYGQNSGGDFSIFVQKFNAGGTLASAEPIRLDALGRSAGFNGSAQVAALGNDGSFVVTWYGIDSGADTSIFVQKFNANGSRATAAPMQLEATGVIDGSDFEPQVTAVGVDGSFVVAWTGRDSTGDNSVFVQKFNANGTKASNFAVALEAVGVFNGNDHAPQVTALGNDGSFVVTWSGQDISGDDSIFVQRFDASGAKVGAAASMLEAVGVSTGDDFAPQVAALGTDGSFVITWSGTDRGGDNSVFVQKFNANGGKTSAIAVQLEAPGQTQGQDQDPQVAALGTDGSFVVTWTGQDSARLSQIYVQKFNASGAKASATPIRLEAPDVTIGSGHASQVTRVGSDGSFVVTWYGKDSEGDDSIFVQKFDASGAKASDRPIQLEAPGVSQGGDYAPQIAALGSDGSFVVTWYGKDSGGDFSVFVKNFDASGVPVQTLSVAENTPTTTVIYTAQATDNVGVSAYALDAGVGDNDKFTIDAQTGQIRFKSSPDFEAPGSAAGSNIYNIRISARDAMGNTAVQALSIQVTDVDDARPDFQALNPLQLEALGVTSADDVAPQVSALGADGSFVVTWYGIDTEGDYSIFVQKFNAGGTLASTQPIQLEALGRNTGFDGYPQVASLGSDGSFVVTWYGLDGGADTSIFVQKFNGDGTKASSAPTQLEASGVTNGSDFDPQVRAVGSDGSFVVTWSGQDSNGDRSVFVQKFNASGTRLTANPILLEATGVFNGNDLAPQVAALGADGSFVVTWHGVDIGGDYSVFVQKFNASGAKATSAPAMLEAVGVTKGADFAPQVAALGSDGSYVVTWFGADMGSDNSVFVQKFNASGSKASAIPVQLEAPGQTKGQDQDAQVAAVGNDGSFVVSWSGQDSAGLSQIYVQKFNASGAKVGTTATLVRAAGTGAGADSEPQVAALGSDGSFVVTWTGKDTDGDASIFVQKFDATGAKTRANPIQLEALGVSNGADQAPQVAALGADGSFVVTWFGKDSGGDNSIFVQKFDASGVPVLNLDVAENTPASAVIYTAHATDNVGVTGYALAAGVDDNDKFMIDAQTGQLRFKSSPDFEAPGSAAGNNTYNVQIKALDAMGNAAVQRITINVTDVRELVILGGDNSGNVAQDAPVSQVTGVLAVTDEDAGQSQDPTTVDHLGTPNNDTLMGTTTSESMAAGLGDDTLVGNGGADMLYGGAGNDRFVINPSNVIALQASMGQGGNDTPQARIDGGTGIDTLQLTAGASLDLTQVANQVAGDITTGSRITRVERLDLASDDAPNTLKLALLDVLDMSGMNLFNTSTGWTNTGNGSALSGTVPRHQCVIDAGAGDVVQMVGSSDVWVQAGHVSHNGHGYVAYNHVTAAAQVLLSDELVPQFV